MGGTPRIRLLGHTSENGSDPKMSGKAPQRALRIRMVTTHVDLLVSPSDGMQLFRLGEQVNAERTLKCTKQTRGTLICINCLAQDTKPACVGSFRNSTPLCRQSQRAKSSPIWELR